MDKHWSKHLMDGEKVLWSGTAASFPLLDKRQHNNRKILARWAAALLLGTGLLRIYTANHDPASPGFIGGVLLIMVLVITAPFLEHRNIRAQRYVITDRRVMVVQRDNTVFSMPLGSIDDFQVVRGESPMPCLVIGACLDEDIGRQLRWRCVHPKEDLSTTVDNVRGLVFYNVPEADDAAALLDRLCIGAA